MTPILTHLAATPRWHTVAEIAAAVGLLPIQVRNRLAPLTEARLVEWDDAGRVALKGGWVVRGDVWATGSLHLGNAMALARVVGGTVEREVA
jgi:DNA-binding IclR family transcriptional regulator